MNSDTENQPAEPSTSDAQTEPQPPASPFAYRGNGKVARLPKSTRDQISQWMRDGMPYPEIIQKLGELGANLTPCNLSEWRKRGFQNWLLEQAWLDNTRARQESAAALATDFDATQINHAALQIGALQIFDALRALTLPPPSEAGSASDPPSCAQLPEPDSQSVHETVPSAAFAQEQGKDGNAPAASLPPHEPLEGAAAGPLAPPRGEGSYASPVDRNGNSSAAKATEANREDNSCHREPNPTPHVPDQKSKIKNQKFSALDLHLGGDSAAFVRLMNALARASRETMLLQKYREACAQARAALRPLRDPNRQLSEQERRAIVREVDGILGLKPIEGV